MNTKIKEIQKELLTTEESLKEFLKSLKIYRERLGALENIKEQKDETIYVPKEIGLSKGTSEFSIGIVNDSGSELCVWIGGINFSVYGSESINNGSNFILKKVDKPEAGKVYLLTNNSSHPTEKAFQSQYALFLTNKIYCRWHQMLSQKIEKCYGVNVVDIPWRNYYEVVYKEK